ncbi:FG-GAP repeat domain-containing protein, partial [Streptomyces sp. NPDC059718]
MGEQGVFHQPSELRRVLWTRYSDGKSLPVPGTSLADPAVHTLTTGSDVLGYLSFALRQVELIDMVSGTSRTLKLPDGVEFRDIYGSVVVAAETVAGPGGTSSTVYHLLSPGEGGSTLDRVVTGLPQRGVEPEAGDATSIVFQTRADGQVRWSMVDPATGAVSSQSAPVTIGVEDYPSGFLTPQYFVWFYGGSTGVGGPVHYVPRSEFGAEPEVVPIPESAPRAYDYNVAIVGDWLVYHLGVPRQDESRQDIMAVPLHGGTPITLFTRSDRGNIASGTDGSVAAVAGENADDWGVKHVTQGADGNLVVSTLYDLPYLPAPVQALALGQGRLVVTDRSLRYQGYHQRTLSTDGAVTYGDRSLISPPDYIASDSPLHALGDGRYIGFWGYYSNKAILTTWGDERNVDSFEVPPDGEITDANGRYVVYTVAAKNAQYVYRLDSNGKDPLERPATVAAVWAGVLWTPGSAAGTLTTTDLATRKATGTVSIGSGCVPRELQALGRWIYWSCGAGGKAGVYDRTAKKSVPVPGDQALLGDGFVVTHDKAAGKLALTDVHTGSAQSRVVGDLPDTGADARHVRWDVDKFTDRIAYVDGDEQVHVLASGVPVQPLSTVDVDNRPTAPRVRFILSKPAASWIFSIRNKANGEFGGGAAGEETRGLVDLDWDSSTVHDLLPNGTYAGTLVVKPADGAGAPLTVTAEHRITDGEEVWRDFDGQDGFGELFAVGSKGALNVRTATGTGKLTPSAALGGAVWDPKTVVVPVGDLNLDNCNDLLVRRSSGALERHLGTCGKSKLGVSTPTRFGTGWNGYNVLTSAGDLSGDGRADLIARQASTSDVWLYKATSDGKLAARVKLASHWTGYKKIVGAGDLNGDGFGDLLVQDKANVLWRYDGDGKGHLKPRVKLASNWGASYNALVGVGDITGDGKADLIARDTAG